MKQRIEAPFEPLNVDSARSKFFVFHHAQMEVARRLDTFHGELEQCSMHALDRARGAYGGTLLVSKEYAGEFGLDPASNGPQPGSIPIAPGITAKGMVFTPDLIIDGNLGMPFLKDYLVTLDLAAGRVWIKRNPVAAPAGMGTPPPPKKS